MQITLDIDDITAALLATLDDEGSAQNAINELVSHAMQGVYRPGSWERPWLTQAFGEDFLAKLEPGDPFNRSDLDSLFERPKIPLAPPISFPDDRTLILRHIRASSPISFSYLTGYATEHQIDDTKLAQIMTDLIYLGHVGLIEQGHSSGFSFTAL